MGFGKFEEIRAWQEARKLTRFVYSLTRKGTFARDFGLRDQIQRASISVMANIAEGFDCESPLEFGRFLSYARRSAVEVQSLFYVALDANHIIEREFDTGYEQARITKSTVAALKKTIKK